jgi:hypothetical protein
MSKKKTKFQLGDHVEYSNKTFGYSYKGVVIAKNGRWTLTKVYEHHGAIGNSYMSSKGIEDDYEFIPEEFQNNPGSVFYSHRSISPSCVWDSSQYLRHVMKPYEEGQNGDTDDDI